MTIANTFASKLFVGVVAIAMALSLVAPAQAATEAELQAQIDQLMATITALQGQIGQGGTSVASGVCPYTWTRSLSSGSTGADVMKLQQFLNADAATRVSASGAGSVGAETEYYGPATAAAVSNFQVMYRDAILTPNGLVNPTGYFGPSTMAKANALCVAGAMDDADDTMDDDDSSDDDSSVTLSGEGSLGDTDLNEGDDTDLEEGQEDAPVAELELNFENGDVMVSRIDVSLTGGTDDQWDTFENVSLWVDGDKVAEKSADSKSDYLGDEDNGVLRFSGLDIVAMEDEDLTIVIAVTVQTGLDTVPDTWDVDVLNVRYSDADDVTTTEDLTTGGLAITATDFDIDEEGGEDEIIVKTSSEDPDATTIQVEETSKSDFITIFAFDLDTDDSVNDITLNDIVINVQTDDAGGTDDLVSDMRLVIDGTEYDDWTIGAANALTTTYSFDIDGDETIDAGDRVTVEVQVEFLKQSGNYAEGATIQATTTGTTIDAEGADDLSGAQLSGAATGDVHTLRTSGAILEMTSSTETLKANTDSTTADDEGVFVIKFDVTAFETDLFVAKSADASTTLGTVGVNYLVEDGAGATVTVNDGTGTTTSSLTSSATTEGGKFKVAEGETKSFTLTVNFDPTTAGFYQLQLGSLNYGIVSTGNPTVLQLATPAEDFETDSLSI